MNGHIESSNVGYDGTHGGFGYGSRKAEGSRILEFADGLNLVICNTLFTKQEAKLVTYVAGPVKSTVDYIMVQQEDKAKVRWHRKFEPRVQVWKLKEEKTCEQYRCMVEDKVHTHTQPRLTALFPEPPG